MDRREIRPGARAAGVVRVPGSKSVSNRHLNLALLARRPVVLERPLIAEDTRAFLTALRRLGLSVSGTARAINIGGGAPVTQAEIDCTASGTMLRFLTATLTTMPGRWVLDGSPRLRERPVGDLVKALRSLGARIDYRRQNGYAPLEIEGSGLAGGSVEVDAGSSSQYVSALMMAAVRARSSTVVRACDLVSAPYVEMTRRAIEEWGGVVERGEDDAIVVRPGRLEGGRFIVEGDFSSACYLAAGAALLGGTIGIAGLKQDSAQGDRWFFDLLVEMGADVAWDEDAVEVTGRGRLTAIDRDMASAPDQVPTVAALAPFARGTTTIRGVPHLRIKESDRLAAVTSGLRRVGAEVEEREDGLVIPGVWAEKQPPSDSVVVETFNDHRIAMSFAVLGLARRGVEIDQPRVVEKSYPDFWRDFGRCFEA